MGPSFQTLLLRRELPGARVDTLGVASPLSPARADEMHVAVDLNDVASASAPVPDGGHDAVVMAEVLEHLHVAPQLVLAYVAAWLRPGGVLVLQTPNAVALPKRVRMLAGRNPYEPIRLSPGNPGHFHEYTRAELRDAVAAAGLVPGGVLTANYFGAGRAHRAFAAVERALPAGLRHGITMWATRPS